MFLTLAFTAFPENSDSIFSKLTNIQSHIEASGSLGLYMYDSVCHPTFPNYTLVEDARKDWCSNVGTAGDMPWIIYNIPNKAMKLRGYVLRNGCCRYYCCCDPETQKDLYFDCCCRLYSFSLHGSNDNVTWKLIHKVEKLDVFYSCQIKEFEFEMTEPFRYIKFSMDEEFPGCPKCMQLNQLDFYGTLTDSFSSYEEEMENEESVSIIGKVKHV